MPSCSTLARGPLVDGDALLDALDSGKLAGAGIDVFDPEPPPPDSRLRNHPRLVATPHSATTTVEARERIEAMAVEEILRYFDGREPNNPLNPEVLNHTAPQGPTCPMKMQPTRPRRPWTGTEHPLSGEAATCHHSQ